MNNCSNITGKLIYTLPRFCLLLFAIQPVTYCNDTIFYVCSILMIVVFLVFVSCLFVSGKEYLYSNLSGNWRDELYECFIAIAGIIVCCSLGKYKMCGFWGLILLLEVLLAPLRRKMEKELKNK